MIRVFIIAILVLTNCDLIATDRPNILWITSEDNGPQLGCYGDEYAVTPNLDKLASKGMVYLHAISNAPVCAPARTTIISGLYPPSTGSEHMRSSVALPPDFAMYPQILRKAGYYCTNNSKEDYNLIKPGKVWDVSGKKAHWKNRQPGQPFFAVFNHTISHESQIRNRIPAKNQIHDPASAPVPAYHPDTPNVRKNWAQYYDRITMMDKRVAANLKELNEAGLAEDTIIFYYGDHGSGMPRSKRWPYNSGLHIPLIVHFPKKWEHLAPKEYKTGGTSDRLVGFIDLAPTLLSVAGIKPPQWMQGHAFAGPHETEKPEFSYGFRGRMDERYDLVRTVRGKRFIYIRNYMPHKTYGQHISYMFQTQTTQDWFRLFNEGKLNRQQAKFWRIKPSEELFDLDNDPDEVNNLVGNKEFDSVLTRMRTAHRNFAKQIRDIGFLSEWEIHQRSLGKTPYEMGHDPESYDFDAVFESAEIATNRRNEISKVRKLLKHDDPAVRYWGAIGMLCREGQGYSHGRDLLNVALNDRSAMVQIMAAESLGRYGTPGELKAAMKVLLKHAAPESNVFLAIAAWNVIDELDEKLGEYAGTIKELSPNPNQSPARVAKYAARLKQKVLADLEKVRQ